MRGHRRRSRNRISIHALREEGDPVSQVLEPAGGQISIHALREEGDSQVTAVARLIFGSEFLSTPSARRATSYGRGQLPRRRSCKFLSTPSARRATLSTASRFAPCSAGGISIHALREEGDLADSVARRPSAEWISIHALREEGDDSSAARTCRTQVDISIHALREEGDRPLLLERRNQAGPISIHALREEGDSGRGRGIRAAHNFYPRPPRGGRRPARIRSPVVHGRHPFLSTPSARRATPLFVVAWSSHAQLDISIHALREEGD